MILLIVEPRKSVRRAVREMLEKAGYVAILESLSAAEALSRLEKLRPACIIIGRDLGNMESTEFCARIREHHRLSATPIILVLGRTTHEDVLEAVEAGVDGCVLIPINEDLLIEKVRRAVDRSNQMVQAEQERKKKSQFSHHAILLDKPDEPRRN